MAFFMGIYSAKTVKSDANSDNALVTRNQFGNSGGKVATKGAKGGTEVYLLPITTDTYVTELNRVSAECADALVTFATLPAKSAWSGLDKDTQKELGVSYWTMIDGQPANKQVNPEYLTRLRLSAYNCIDADASANELDILRAVRHMDKIARCYFQFIAVLKTNDSIAKAMRTQLDTITELDDHGCKFIPSDDTASIAA